MHFMPRNLCKSLLIPIFAVIFAAAAAACGPSPVLQATATSMATIALTPTPQITMTTAAPTVTQTPAGCADTKGIITDVEIPSTLLKEPIKAKIYTPPCYDRSKQYPTLYMLHGMTYLDDQWVRIGLTDAADRLISVGEIVPMIIVMPQEDQSMSDSNTSFFGTALVKEVVPWVDQYFTTCRDRACRAIGGLSRGGNWAVRVGLTSWQTFGAIGAHSAPLFYNDLGRLSYMINKIPDRSLIPQIYIDGGDDDDDREDVRLFDAELTRLKVPHEYHVFNGYHDEEYWSAHVADYLRWYSSVFTGTK
jgi:enterochelin esterase-like enzyme